MIFYTFDLYPLFYTRNYEKGFLILITFYFTPILTKAIFQNTLLSGISLYYKAINNLTVIKTYF